MAVSPRRRTALLYLAAFFAATLLFLLLPDIDLWTSGIFYRPDGGFFLAQWAPVRILYRAIPWVVGIEIAAVPLIVFAGWRRGRTLFGIDGRAGAYLLLVLALGPGLLVNTVLKDHWGRARPVQISEFGGTQLFTAAPLPADQCATNCSFVAGHPAVAFSLIAFAFIARGKRRRWIAAGAIAAGALEGAVRLAQGGHFLSDVVFAGLLVSALASCLAWLMLEREGGARLWQRVGERLGPAAAHWLNYGLVALAAVAASYLYIDRPVAVYFRDANPDLVAVARDVTRLGVSTYYLIGTAIAAAALWLAAKARHGPQAARLKRFAAVPVFLFLSIAVSGLATDLLKVVFGRARPKLLFANETFGFDWWGTKADFWSFPSGHATTAVAIAAALYCLWPRFAPVYAVFALAVSLSRVVVGAHYPSDVIVAAAIAIGSVAALQAGFARRGVDLKRAASGGD